jgi:hypothetical protein
MAVLPGGDWRHEKRRPRENRITQIRNRETRRLAMSAAPVSRFAAIRRSSSVKSLRTRISEVDMNIPLRHLPRTDGGWRYDGFTPPQDHDVYWLRVRGQVRSGFLNGSGGVIENARIVHVRGNDRIFANGFE